MPSTWLALLIPKKHTWGSLLGKRLREHVKWKKVEKTKLYLGGYNIIKSCLHVGKNRGESGAMKAGVFRVAGWGEFLNLSFLITV